MKHIFLLLLTVLVVCGCATSAKDIPAAYVSPTYYADYSCDQLREEETRLRAKVSELGGRADDRASNDKVATGIGLILFWPALFFIKGDKTAAAEFGQVKGYWEALQETMVTKDCAEQAPTTVASTEPVMASDVEAPEQLIQPSLTSIRYQSAKTSTEAYVWVDLTWTGLRLEGPVKDFEGDLLFQDHDGKTHARIAWRVDRPLDPYSTVIERNVGFDIEADTPSARWFQGVTPSDVVVTFEPRTINYTEESRS